MSRDSREFVWGTVVPLHQGQLKLDSLLIPTGHRGIHGSVTPWIWLPPDEYVPAGEKPSKYGILFNCHRGVDGLRRFSLVGPAQRTIKSDGLKVSKCESIIIRTAMIGLRSLDVPGDVSDDEAENLHLDILIFQRCHRTDTHKRRAFNCKKDFLKLGTPRPPRRKRNEPREATILEFIDLYDTPRVKKGQLTFSRLRNMGQRAALAAGLRDPETSTCTRYGLAVHAKGGLELAPEGAHIPVESIRQSLCRGDGQGDTPIVHGVKTRSAELVRHSLFQIDGPIKESVVNAFAQRMKVALLGHMSDPTDKFDKFFFDGKNSLIKQIAQQKTAPGGELDLADAHRGLSEIGWSSYLSLAELLERQMTAIAQAMPEPLTDQELRIYAQMHYRQPWLGDLTLVMLGQRLDFLEGALGALYADPDDPLPIAVLHRLLFYYDVLSSHRRERDRDVTRARKCCNDSYILDNAPDKRATKGKPNPEFDMVLTRVLRARRILCDCVVPSWSGRINEDGQEKLVEYWCTDPACSKHSPATFPLIREEFAEAVKGMNRDARPGVEEEIPEA